MLPGYNHNVRYKDKLFHVQTEDNGLDDPDLVTQVFLGGQIVAIERSSYGEVLVDGLEEKARDERIKSLMQEQHKRLLKNLIRGEYDAKIDRAPVAQKPLEAGPSPAPAAEHPELSISIDVAIDEAVEEDPTFQPSHTPNFAALDAAILAAEQNPITPESLLAPDAVLELSTSELFAEQPRPVSLADTDPIPRPSISKTPTPPQAFLVEHLKNVLKKPDGRADSDRFDHNDDAMLGMIEQHMHQQLPWAPAEAPAEASTAATLEEPQAPAAISHIQRARELAKNADSGVETKRIPIDQAMIGIDEMPTKLGRKKPPVPKPAEQAPSDTLGKQPDTLVDYGLPAALRREIDAEIARRSAAEPTPPPEVVPSPALRAPPIPGTAEVRARPRSDSAAKPRSESTAKAKSESVAKPRSESTARAKSESVAKPRSVSTPRAQAPGLTAPPVPATNHNAAANANNSAANNNNVPQPRASSSASISISKSTPGSQKDVRVSGIYRGAPQKPEGRYSSVRKTPEKLPDTLIDIDRGKVEAEAARARSTPAIPSAGSRRVTRPPAPDPKTSTPPAPAPRKIVEKQAPSAPPEKQPAQEDTKRPSILVVERSLDEVILSYLYDEMAEK